MAFVRVNWQKITSSLNDGQPRGWSYSSLTDSTSDIEGASGYFNDVSDEITSEDFVYIRATDTSLFYRMIVSGVDVSLTRLTDIFSDTLPFETNAAGTVEKFYLSISPRMEVTGGSVLMLDEVTGDSEFTIELLTLSTGAIPIDLGVLVFSANATVPRRLSFNVSPAVEIPRFVETYWIKTNTGTAQSVKFLGTVEGNSL